MQAEMSGTFGYRRGHAPHTFNCMEADVELHIPFMKTD
jgi:hypothetical protein